MPENKWVGLSRSLWATLLPMGLLILDQTGVAGSAQIGELANTIVTSVIVIASGVLQFLHMRNPQPTSAAKQ